jgi:hypothetical protein
MLRTYALLSLSIAASLAGATCRADVSAAARDTGVSRAQAERNVLGALARGWGRRRIPALVNHQTRLLRNNTQVICRRVRARGALARFLCLVRPARHRRGQGLYVAYRARAHGRFTLRWLFYRPGR